MVKKYIFELLPGMKIAEDVYNFNKQLVLTKNVVLTDKSIAKLEFYSVVSVKIHPDISKETANTLVFSENSYFTKVRSSNEFKEFKQNFDNELIQFKSTLNSVVELNTELDIHVLLGQAIHVLNSAGNSVNVLDMLQNMRHYDDSTFAHSLNVSLICNLFAKWLHLSKEDIETATVCGMLHDIGKLMIPDSIIKKPSKLTDSEFAIIKTHPIEGYNLLNRFNIDPHIKNTALMHHEKCDGSGYPFGLTRDKISKYAKIVAIADVYDAMTSARIYRGALCPFKVISVFESEGLQKYDTKYILTFLERVISTYLSNKVLLNNGQEGDIIYINPQKLAKPVIKIGSEYVDLAQEPDLFIDEII